MSLYDRQVTPQVTDEISSSRLSRQLTQAVGMARVCVRRVTGQVSNAPGGKAGLVAALSTDGQEVVDILDKLVALVNAHKNAGDADVIAPLVQGDLA